MCTSSLQAELDQLNYSHVCVVAEQTSIEMTLSQLLEVGACGNLEPLHHTRGAAQAEMKLIVPHYAIACMWYS
jgi:hypothetical protein